MKLGMDLDFDKYCVVDGNSDTVIRSPLHSSRSERKKAKEKPIGGNDLLRRSRGYSDISFQRFRSASCKTHPHRTEGHEAPRRGSVYHSSQGSKNMKKVEDDSGRKKIEFPRSSATALSFGIIDSLCDSDEDNLQVEQSRPALNQKLVTSLNKACNLQGFVDQHFSPLLELGLSSEANQSTDKVEMQMCKDFKGICDPVVRPIRDGTKPRKLGPASTLHKSLSAKLALPHSPSHSESECSISSSPKSYFSPIQKLFDPFTKSKLQRSSLDSASQSVEVASVEKGCNTRKKTLRKSLLHDNSDMSLGVSSDYQSGQKEYNKPLRPCSPAHLLGSMKLISNHGVPFYEFSVHNSEDIFLAKGWRIGDAQDWVYTFHNYQNKRKINANRQGLKKGNNVSSIVGQMQVSCSFCSELEDAKIFDRTLVREFVLYDVAQVRKNISSPSCSLSLPDIAKLSIGQDETSTGQAGKLDASDPIMIRKHLSKHNILTPTVLHPNLEIAAIIIEVPFENRESLNGKGGDQKCDQPLHDFHFVPVIEERTNIFNPSKVNVVTTPGNHSLPTTESPGPSRLLDRWKYGGSCDCGGWDMGCPLLVFGSSDIHCTQDNSFFTIQQPLKLYAQGRKEEAPSLKMTVTEGGQYEVDFHAQLTTLQAFSVCVAILHCTETSIAGAQDIDKRLLQCDPLRFFMDDEVKCLIDSVAQKEMERACPKIEEGPRSFVLDPPFSPMARV